MGHLKRQRAACVSGDTAPFVPLIKSVESELVIRMSSEAVKQL